MSNDIVYHNSIEQDEFPSPNSTNEPGLHIACTRLLKYTEKEGMINGYVPCTLEEPEQNNRLFRCSVSVKEV